MTDKKVISKGPRGKVARYPAPTRTTSAVNDSIQSLLLRGLAIVVPKQPTQVFPTPNLAFSPAHFVTSFDDRVLQSLVISLGVVMAEILPNCSAKHVFAEASCLMLPIKRSMCGVRFADRGGSRTAFMPSSSRHLRNDSLNFVSRSMIKYRVPLRKPSSKSVRFPQTRHALSLHGDFATFGGVRSPQSRPRRCFAVRTAPQE